MAKKKVDLASRIEAGYRYHYRPGTMTVDVSNPTGDIYRVALAFPGSCDCPAHRLCKHLQDCWTLKKGGLFSRE